MIRGYIAVTDFGNQRCHSNSSLCSLISAQDFRVIRAKNSHLQDQPPPSITLYHPAISSGSVLQPCCQNVKCNSLSRLNCSLLLARLPRCSRGNVSDLLHSPQNAWGDGLGVSQQPLGVTNRRSSRPLQSTRAQSVPLLWHGGCQYHITECTTISRNDRSIKYLPVLTKIPRMPAFWAPPTSSLQSWGRTGDPLVSGHRHYLLTSFFMTFSALHITNQPLKSSYTEPNCLAAYQTNCHRNDLLRAFCLTEQQLK